MTLWRLEWLRLVRSHRLLALVGTYLFFGLTGPLTARYLSALLGRLGTEGVRIEFPEPTPADGIAQFVGNVSQIGLLVVVLVAASALAFDARREMAVFLRTRVRGVRDIIVPAYVSTVAAAVAALVVGSLAAWYETAVLLGGVPVAAMLAGIGLGSLFLAFAGPGLSPADAATSTTVTTPDSPFYGGTFVTPVKPGEKMLVESDQLVYDYDRRIVSAVGHVRIYYGQYTLTADRVSYNETSGRLLADGNVVLVDPMGTVFRSTHVDITANFRDAFVASLNVETSQRTFFSAERAERQSGTVVTFINGTYNGALTFALVDAIRQSKGVLTYRELHDRASGVLKKKKFDQVPQLEGRSANFDRTLFS